MQFAFLWEPVDGLRKVVNFASFKTVLKYELFNTAYMGGSVVKWLACWTQVQKGPGSDRSRDAVG